MENNQVTADSQRYMKKTLPQCIYDDTKISHYCLIFFLRLMCKLNYEFETFKNCCMKKKGKKTLP